MQNGARACGGEPGPRGTHPIGSSKRGAACERPTRVSVGPLGELSDSKRGTVPRRKPDVDGDATTGGLARQARSGKPWPSGTPGVTDQFRRPPLHAHRIGDGEGACLRATHRQVKEGLRRELSRAVDDLLLINDGDDFHPPATLGTGQRIDLADLADQARPSRLSPSA